MASDTWVLRLKIGVNVAAAVALDTYVLELKYVTAALASDTLVLKPNLNR